MDALTNQSKHAVFSTNQGQSHNQPRLGSGAFSRVWYKGTLATTMPTKTSVKNINPRNINYSAIIPTRSNCIMWPNNPGTNYRNGVQIKKENEKIMVLCSRSPHYNLEFGHFTLLFYTGRLRNVPEFKTCVQSDCVSSF